MLFKAKKLGFYAGTRRYPGDVFEVPEPKNIDDKTGKKLYGVEKWAEPATGVEPDAPTDPLQGARQKRATPPKDVI